MKIRFACLILLSFLSCNSSSEKKENSIAGEYKRGTNSITIATTRPPKIEVSICFANETCIEPCYNGTLNSAGNKRFSGWVYPETRDTTEKHLVTLSFFKNEIGLLFPQRDRLGMNCDP